MNGGPTPLLTWQLQLITRRSISYVKSIRDMSQHVMHTNAMTPRKLQAQSLYLEPTAAKRLDELAARTRIPKAVLLREAVDDLLAKHDPKGPQRRRRTD